MKKIVEIISLLILYAELINCQPDNSRLKYYPIHIGDKWQYERIADYFDGYVEKSLKTVEVTGDTVLNNGHRYYIFEESSNLSNDKSYHYRRIDTLSFKVYEYYPYILENIPEITCQDSERVIFYLALNDTTEWTDCSHEAVFDIQHSILEEQVGKINLFRNQIHYRGNYWIFLKTLSEDIGLSEYDYGELMLITETLSYAKINNIEYGEIVGIDSHEQNIPTKIKLYQNYPNPFNPSTTINFTIPNSEFVTLKVYDILGNEVATLVKEYKSAGTYNVQFSTINPAAGGSISSGVYFYKLQAGSFTQSKKMILLQ